MSLLNLKSDFLYKLLPQGIIELDERFLIQSLVSGYQDRLEDVRAYGNKLEKFFDPTGLPERGPNVVQVDVLQASGKTYTHSIDIDRSTPVDPAKLAAWAAARLGVDVASLSTARLAVDALRLVDASILDYLATNLGAVLHRSAVRAAEPDVITSTGTYTAQEVANQRLLEYYFPRLKFKGTARSFEALGKLMGFDDVRMMPLWSRVSAHLPSDPGSPVNNLDFAEKPEFYPQQQTGVLYDPLDQRDGPFYAWSGTVSQGTSAQNYYPQSVNGYQPWIRVDVLGVSQGTSAHPADGTYLLAGGGPHTRASVAAGSDFRFTALGEGAAWNNISVAVVSWGVESLRRLEVTDRLSSVKYRSSFFNLGLTVAEDRAETVFGTLAAKANRDVSAGTHAYPSFSGVLYGTSPYRPFTSGEGVFRDPTGIQTVDYLTTSGGTLASYTERYEADLSVKQQDTTALVTAGHAVAQAMEEVRPATRHPRRIAYGYLAAETVGYAPLRASETVMVVATTGSQAKQVTGVLLNAPTPPYTARVVFTTPTQAVTLAAEANAADPTALHYRTVTGGTLTGYVVLSGAGTNVYNFYTNGVFTQTGTLTVQFYGTLGPNNAPDSHEVVRVDPGTITDKRYMDRPEDELDDALVYETTDDFPWRRDIVGGGELVELDFVTVQGTDTQGVLELDNSVSVKDQTGAEWDAFTVNNPSQLFTVPKMVFQARSLDPYLPGQHAVAFRGQFMDQSKLTADQLGLRKSAGGRTSYFRSELDSVFQPGYSLYHVGLVSGVLVADAAAFNSDWHAQHLVGWLPMNEHPTDDLGVTDRARQYSTNVLAGVSAADRKWDDSQGLYLHLVPGATLTSSAIRSCSSAYTVSFWVKADTGTLGTPEPLAVFGNLRFERYGTNMLRALIIDASGTERTIGQSSIANWTFVGVRKSAGSAVFAAGDYSAGYTNYAAQAAVVYAYADNSDQDVLLVQGGTYGCALRDVRVWNSQKTAAELAKAYYHQPTPTGVPYRISAVVSLNTTDRSGLKVLPTGWVVPAAMPAWVRAPKYARVLRYDSSGQYKGEPWRKEVGLGGGQMPPARWQLGQQFYSMTATGVLVAAPQLGALPGSSAFWRADATGAPGKYIVLTGSTASGTTAVVTTSGSGASPWPNRMEAVNPIQDVIWLPDDAGHVYAARLEASGNYTAQFKVTAGTQSYQEQGGALAQLASPGTVLGVTGYGSVVQKVSTGTRTTPNLYMYLHDTLLEDVGGAQTFARWTDPSAFGTTIGFPALKQAGELALTNTTALAPGVYRLRLDLGNVGKVDDNFNGYRLELILADVVVDTTALSGFSGSDFRGVHEVEFVLDHAIPANWILTLNWFNDLVAPTRGTARQLVLYGYALRRLETNVYQVSIAGAGTVPAITRLTVLNQNYGTIPGGWMLGYNSYGTVVQTTHEGTKYAQNDTLRTKYSLANGLTGCTESHREDVLVAGTRLLPDSTDPVLTSFGVLNSAGASGVQLSGAGSAAANGTYAYNNEDNGVYYRKNADTYLLNVPVDDQHQVWYVMYQGNVLYYAVFEGDAATLSNPADGVWVADTGLGPVPTVTVVAGGGAYSQVGDYLACNVVGSAPAGSAPAYVWRFWDGEVIATGTTSGSALKLITRGGNPAEGGSAPFKLPFRCDICDQLGNVAQTLTATVKVNNPPTIYGAPTVTPNNAAFPFDAAASVTVYDHEEAGINFYWYAGTIPLGGGTTTGPISVAGTYWGTLTGTNHSSYTNHFGVSVKNSGTTLTCKAVDGNAGTTAVDFPLLGYDPNSARNARAASTTQIVVDVGLPPAMVIGPRATIDFTAYGFDPAPGVLVFAWSLYGSNGWNAPDAPVASAGTLLAMERGYRSTFTRSIGQEVGTGERIALVSVTNSETGQSTSAQVPVQLVQNSVPVISAIGVYDAQTGEEITSIDRQTAPTRTVVRLSGTAADQNDDVVFYQWDITAPVDPTSYTLYGRDIYIDVTDFPAPSTQATLGVLTVFDRHGSPSASLALPTLEINS